MRANTTTSFRRFGSSCLKHNCHGKSAERHPFRTGICETEDDGRSRTRRNQRQWLPDKHMGRQPTCDLCCKCTSYSCRWTHPASIEWRCKVWHPTCRYCQEGTPKLLSQCVHLVLLSLFCHKWSSKVCGHIRYVISGGRPLQFVCMFHASFFSQNFGQQSARRWQALAVTNGRFCNCT